MKRLRRIEYSRPTGGGVLLLPVLLAACGANRGHGQGEPDGGTVDALVWFDGQAQYCGQVTRPLAFEERLADVLIVFDRSGSMASAFGSGTRYSVEAEILKDLISTYEGRIRFGFEQFPARAGCGGGSAVGCCGEDPVVGVDRGQALSIGYAIEDAAPVEGNTPTADALRRAGRYFAALDDGVADRYVMLSTDGHPSCGAAGGLAEDMVVGGRYVSGPCTDSLQAVASLTEQGVKTIVMGVGGGLDIQVLGAPSCLEELAHAGGAAREAGQGGQGGKGPSFFQATSPDELAHTLQRIFGAVVESSCLIRLATPPPDMDHVALFFDGREVPLDPTRQNGWDWEVGAPLPTIHVFGDYCKRVDHLQVAEIEVRHGCPPCLDPKVCE